MMPTLLGKEVCERATLSCALPLYSFVIIRVGQNRIYAPYMTVYLVIFLPRLPHIHRVYMVMANREHVSADLKCVTVTTPMLNKTCY